MMPTNPRPKRGYGTLRERIKAIAIEHRQQKAEQAEEEEIQCIQRYCCRIMLVIVILLALGYVVNLTRNLLETQSLAIALSTELRHSNNALDEISRILDREL